MRRLSPSMMYLMGKNRRNIAIHPITINRVISHDNKVLLSIAALMEDAKETIKQIIIKTKMSFLEGYTLFMGCLLYMLENLDNHRYSHSRRRVRRPTPCRQHQTRNHLMSAKYPVLSASLPKGDMQSLMGMSSAALACRNIIHPICPFDFKVHILALFHHSEVAAWVYYLFQRNDFS